MLIISSPITFSAPEWDQPIYELGSKCEKDADCTTYEESKCDMLCVKPKVRSWFVLIKNTKMVALRI